VDSSGLGLDPVLVSCEHDSESWCHKGKESLD
jgi:hypothetical protein